MLLFLFSPCLPNGDEMDKKKLVFMMVPDASQTEVNLISEYLNKVASKLTEKYVIMVMSKRIRFADVDDMIKILTRLRADSEKKVVK